MKGRGAAVIPAIGLAVYLGAILGMSWLAWEGLTAIIRYVF